MKKVIGIIYKKYKLYKRIERINTKSDKKVDNNMTNRMVKDIMKN